MSQYDYPLDNKVTYTQLEKSIITMNKSAMEALHIQDYEESISLLNKSLQILKLSKASDSSYRLRAVTLNNLGLVYHSMKEFPKALQFLSSALEISRNLSTDVINRAGTHLNICAIKSGLNQHEQALQHALTAIQMLSMKKSEFSPTLVVAYHSAGIEYQFLNLPLKARSYFEYGLNISAQKLGKTHNLTLTLEEALQDYYGYKAKTRQKSKDGFLEKRKASEGYKESKPYPKYISPIEKIYTQDLSIKNRPEQSFLVSPPKVRKRVFIRQEISSRVRNMIMQNKVRDESFRNFNAKAVTNFEKEYSGSDEGEEEEEPFLEKLDEKESFEEDTEGMILKFREEIAEGSNEESSAVERSPVVRKYVKAASVKNVEVPLTACRDSEGVKERALVSSPCKLEEDEERIVEKDKEGKKLENREKVQDSDGSGEEQERADEDQEVFENGEQEELNFDEEKLKIVEDTLQHLDEKVQAFTDDRRILIFSKPEEKVLEMYVPAPNRENEALTIQKNFRGWIQKLKFHRLRAKVVKIQKAWKEHRYLQYLKRVKNIKIDFAQQLNEEMFIFRPVLTSCEVQTEPPKKAENVIVTNSVQMVYPYNLYKSFHRTIILIQSHIRGFLCRLMKKKKFKALKKMQGAVRMHQTRKIYLNILQAIIFIQQVYRAHLQRKRKRLSPKKLTRQSVSKK